MGKRKHGGERGPVQPQSCSKRMVTFWLFCLAASALSSGRAAEEEEGEKAREDGGGGGAFGWETEQIWKVKAFRKEDVKRRRGEKGVKKSFI